VTITSRGNNLNVNISSNQNAMVLFMQNSSEFRNTLQNLGFNNVDMSFNSNSQGGQNGGGGQNGKQEGNSNSLQYYSENDEETIDSIDLTIPQYI